MNEVKTKAAENRQPDPVETKLPALAKSDPATMKLEYIPPNLRGAENQIALLSALTAPSNAVWYLVPIEMSVVNFYKVTRQEPDMETGEMGMVNRVLFQDVSGDWWSTRADNVYRALSGIIAVAGDPPWDPPFTISFTAQKTHGKKDMLWAQVLGRALPKGSIVPPSDRK